LVVLLPLHPFDRRRFAGVEGTIPEQRRRSYEAKASPTNHHNYRLNSSITSPTWSRQRWLIPKNTNSTTIKL
jgi:hypothetical protein